jgi:hypothetical protein
MAESERLRGNRSPVTNYKVGDGSIKDLFRYIMGDDLDVKKIKPKRKQTKVTKKDKESVRQIITSGIQGSVEAVAPNPFGADQLKDNRGDSMMGPIVEPPGEVLVENLPPMENNIAPPLSNQPMSLNMNDMEMESMLERDQGNVLDSGQTYRMGMNRPNTPMENPAGTFGGELLRPQGMGQEMYGGGRVMKKKKKKKKKLAGGGKVTSYNY